MQTDGNVVHYNSAGSPTWASGTYVNDIWKKYSYTYKLASNGAAYLLEYNKWLFITTSTTLHGPLAGTGPFELTVLYVRLLFIQGWNVFQF